MITDDEIRAIGGKLRKLRENLGYTQREFADELYWDVSSYQKIECGKTLLTLDKAVQIHRKYGVDLNFFIADDIPGDEDDILAQFKTIASDEETERCLIRLLEYFVSILKSDLKE
jgi:transcriptional regulator with XRE-family HTH domain